MWMGFNGCAYRWAGLVDYPSPLLQLCYDHCKSVVMNLIEEQLNNLFSVHKSHHHHHHHHHHSTMPDLSIAYGLLLKGCVTDTQHLSDQLCQEVKWAGEPLFLTSPSIFLTPTSPSLPLPPP
jgi:hypothetical protein